MPDLRQHGFVAEGQVDEARGIQAYAAWNSSTIALLKRIWLVR